MHYKTKKILPLSYLNHERPAALPARYFNVWTTYVLIFVNLFTNHFII